MGEKSTWASLLSGVLVANSAPHLASAVTGRRHLTPLAGRESSPPVNGAWGAANLAGGLLLLQRAAGARSSSPWDERLHWFDVGAAVFSVWMAGSELALRANTPAEHGHRARRQAAERQLSGPDDPAAVPARPYGVRPLTRDPARVQGA